MYMYEVLWVSALLKKNIYLMIKKNIITEINLKHRKLSHRGINLQ